MVKINDIPFEPKFEQKHIAQAKAFLFTRRNEFKATANFAIIREDCDKTSFHIANQCHSAINSGHGVLGERVLVATENGIDRVSNHTSPYFRKSKEDVKRFLEWFVNESYYGRFIVEKDLDYCLNQGFIVSCDVYAPLMQNVLIITRHFYEVSRKKFNKFDELLDKGVDPLIAYPMCFNTTFDQEFSSQDVVRSYSGHRAHPLFNLRAWQNWLSGEIGVCTKPEPVVDRRYHYRFYPNYVGGAKFFFDTIGDSTYTYDQGRNHFLYELVRGSKEFRNDLSEYRGNGSIETYSPPNPFKRPTFGAPVRKPEDLSYKELWEFALPWCLKNDVFKKGIPSNG